MPRIEGARMLAVPAVQKMTSRGSGQQKQYYPNRKREVKESRYQKNPQGGMTGRCLLGGTLPSHFPEPLAATAPIPVLQRPQGVKKAINGGCSPGKAQPRPPDGARNPET